jgi:glucose dehydrogenase
LPGDKGSTRYSPIDQINAANVRTLAVFPIGTIDHTPEILALSVP